MNLKDNYDSLIFDLDGTLWDSTEPICKAWNIILAKHPEVNKAPITKEELFDCMGLPMYDIAAKLLPDQSKEVQKSLMDEMCAFENDYLAENGAVLYEGLKDTLDVLKKKYRLFIVSNCQDGYIEAFIKSHNMEEYFEDTECWGRTRLPKSESNKILVQRNNLKNPVYIGDTAGDAKAAKEAGIPFIFAAYGFGEVNESEYIERIEAVSQLKEIL